jgi:hypothetical protein
MALVAEYISGGCRISIYDDCIIRDKREIENLLKDAAQKYQLSYMEKPSGGNCPHTGGTYTEILRDETRP